MAKYDIKHTCGHEETVALFGKTKDRERRIEWLEGQPCRECQLKQSTEYAMAAASEMGLPDLSGSPKQIEWAVRIRNDIVKQFESFRNISNEASTKFDLLLSESTSAKWWIDNRDADIVDLLHQFKPSNDVQQKSQESVLDELMVTPDGSEGKIAVTIITTETLLTLKSDKDDQVISIAKAYGLRWDGTAWIRDIGMTAGKVQDRAAELGNALLSAGYPVRFDSQEIRTAAVSGQFIPESTKWVIRNDSEHLKVWWKGHDDNIYSLVKSIKTAKYEKGVFIVNVAQWREIMDLQSAGFTISDKALNTIEMYKAAHASKIEVELAKQLKSEGSLGDILNSSDDILADLKDD